jgi:hypothetical protein
MADVFREAEAYAVMGWPVFPCRPGAKTPLTEHGCRDATTDLEQVAGWSRRWPDANIGLATGAPGPDVVDVDVKNGAPGRATYTRLRDAGLLRGAFAVVATPSGGRHLYYAGSEQGNGSLRDLGVDFRSRGGYVLAPPSQAAGLYRLLEHRWEERSVDWTAIRVYVNPPRPERPATIVAGRADGDHSALIRHVEQLKPGNRNNGLHWAACRAADEGAGPDVFRALVAVAVHLGLPELEARRTVQSAQFARKAAA